MVGQHLRRDVVVVPELGGRVRAERLGAGGRRRSSLGRPCPDVSAGRIGPMTPGAVIRRTSVAGSAHA